MKKFPVLIISFVVILLTALPVNAMAEVITDTMTMTLDKPSVIANAVPVEIEDFEDAAGQATSTIEPFVYTYLKAIADNPHITIPFNVSEDGMYDVVVEVMSNAGELPRTGLIQIDDSDKVYMNTLHGDRTQIPEYFTGMQVMLSAGDHKVHLYLGDDFDDTTVKSLFFDKFYVVKTGEIPVVETHHIEEAPVQESAPVQQVKATVTAPQTNDITLIFSVMAVGSLLAGLKIKMRKK